MGFDFDSIVIGAGIVGLACGRELSGRGLSVAVLEAEQHPLMHTSSRNSEVIHAGIYYPKGSLKASLCVAGKSKLYSYLREKRVDYQKIGKLIVATSNDDVSKLEAYKAAAAANGVTDLEWRSQSEVAALEPSIICTRALWSPSTGILDTHGYGQALEADLEAHGGLVICRSPVSTVERIAGGWKLQILGQGESVTCETLVNSAGLYAVDIAGKIERLASRFIPEPHYAIGHYFTLSGRSPFKHLIYPTATNAGLGVHVTLDIAGQVRFGPDVTWIDSIDYSFDEGKKAAFAAAIQRYYPTLDAGRLMPGYTGIRPKISGKGEPAADFQVQGQDVHGCEGLVNLFGIESPGITASLALAELVANKLEIPVS